MCASHFLEELLGGRHIVRTERMNARTKSLEQSVSSKVPTTCDAFIGLTFCT